LRLDTVDRGTYKEKRTELIAQRVHGFGATGSTSSVSMPSSTSATTARSTNKAANSNPSNAPSNVVPIANNYVPVASAAADAPDYDDIPF